MCGHINMATIVIMVYHAHHMVRLHNQRSRGRRGRWGGIIIPLLVMARCRRANGPPSKAQTRGRAASAMCGAVRGTQRVKGMRGGGGRCGAEGYAAPEQAATGVAVVG